MTWIEWLRLRHLWLSRRHRLLSLDLASNFTVSSYCILIWWALDSGLLTSDSTPHIIRCHTCYLPTVCIFHVEPFFVVNAEYWMVQCSDVTSLEQLPKSFTRSLDFVWLIDWGSSGLSLTPGQVTWTCIHTAFASYAWTLHCQGGLNIWCPQWRLSSKVQTPDHSLYTLHSKP